MQKRVEIHMEKTTKSVMLHVDTLLAVKSIILLSKFLKRKCPWLKFEPVLSILSAYVT